MKHHSILQKNPLLEWRLIIAVLIFCLGGGLQAAHAQSGAQIKKIKFIGNTTISDKELRRQMEIHRSSQFSKIILGKKKYVYDEKSFSKELEELSRYYQRQGFLDVVIGEPRVDYNRKQDQVRLVVPVSEGPSIHTRNITYILPSEIDPAEAQRLNKAIGKRRERMFLQPGKRFTDSDLMVDQDTIRVVLGNQGYPYGNPQYQLTVDTLARQVDITWNIDTGPLSHFDSLYVRGNKRVGEKIIAKMKAFRPGQRFDRRLIDRTQQHVYGLGMFQVATVHAIFRDPPDPAVPVEIVIREQPRYRAQTGVGYGREERFRVFLDLRKYGFLGGARQLRLYSKYSHLEPYNIRLTLTQPAFFHPRSVLSITPYIWRQDEEAFSVRRIGGETGLTHTFNPRLSGSANYVFENVELLGDTLVPDLIVKGTAVQSYRKSSVVFNGQYDSSAPIFSPVRGYFAVANLTYSGLAFGDFRFWKLVNEVRHYRRYWGVVFAGRLKAGSIRNIGGGSFIPYEERLFAGGSASVRGWARHELGPKLAGVPIGGNSLFEGSFEVRYPVYGILGGAIFMDFGNVWLQSFKYKIDDLRYAAGVGARITTPFGPVRFDVARPVFDAEKRFQFHITIGQAF